MNIHTRLAGGHTADVLGATRWPYTHIHIHTHTHIWTHTHDSQEDIRQTFLALQDDHTHTYTHIHINTYEYEHTTRRRTYGRRFWRYKMTTMTRRFFLWRNCTNFSKASAFVWVRERPVTLFRLLTSRALVFVCGVCVAVCLCVWYLCEVALQGVV